MHKLANNLSIYSTTPIEKLAREGFKAFGKKDIMNKLGSESSPTLGNLYEYINGILSAFFNSKFNFS